MDSALAPVWAKVKPAGMFLSGGLFGLGWFVAADALARSALVLHAPVPPTYALPGVVATLALLLIVAVRRADLSSGGDGGGMYDDGAGARARCALFLGYAMSFGAVSGAVVALVLARQQQEGGGGAGGGGGGSGGDLWMPAAIVIQTAAIAGAAMMAFVSHGGEDEDEWGYSGF